MIKLKGAGSFQSPAPHKTIRFRLIQIRYNMPLVDNTFPANRSSNIVA